MPRYGLFSRESAAVQNIYGTYFVVITWGIFYSIFKSEIGKCVRGPKSNYETKHRDSGTSKASTGIPKVSFQLWKGSTPVNPKIWLTPQ